LFLSNTELYILSEVEKHYVSFLNRRIVFTEKLPREEVGFQAD